MRTYLVASGGDNWLPLSSRMTRRSTSSNGTNIDVTNSGIACNPSFSTAPHPHRKKKNTNLRRPQNRTKHQNRKASIRRHASRPAHNPHIQKQNKHQTRHDFPQHLPRHPNPPNWCPDIKQPWPGLLQQTRYGGGFAVHLAPPLLGDHLPPDGVPLPCDVLALVELELLLCECSVASGDAFCIEVE